jgi:hypothetical protein
MLLRHSEIQYSFTNIGHARADGKQPPPRERVGVSAYWRVVLAYWRIGVWEEFFGAAGEFCCHGLHRPQISKDLRAMQAKVIRPRFD